MMTAHRIILEMDHKSPRQGRVYYSTGPDEDPRTSLDLLWGDWEAMGEPSLITVTVEPGDLLNG